jgi:hypothetical protein
MRDLTANDLASILNTLLVPISNIEVQLELDRVVVRCTVGCIPTEDDVERLSENFKEYKVPSDKRYFLDDIHSNGNLLILVFARH